MHIEYDATMCSEALNALDLGRDFYTTPMLSALLNRPIHTDKVRGVVLRRLRSSLSSTGVVM